MIKNGTQMMNAIDEFKSSGGVECLSCHSNKLLRKAPEVWYSMVDIKTTCLVCKSEWTEGTA